VLVLQQLCKGLQDTHITWTMQQLLYVLSCVAGLLLTSPERGLDCSMVHLGRSALLSKTAVPESLLLLLLLLLLDLGCVAAYFAGAAALQCQILAER
jgi:hypothetical protein